MSRNNHVVLALLAVRPGPAQAASRPGYSGSPARTGAVTLSPSGAKGHSQAGLYRQDGWYRKFRSMTSVSGPPPRSAPLAVSSRNPPPP